MLKLHEITRRFGSKTVIEELSFDFPQRGAVALMGPSGCGKTTLLRLAAGLDRPQSGTVENTFQKTAIAFQEPRLLPFSTVRENIRFVVSDPDDARVDQLLSLFELEAEADALPAALSGGMKQRVSLARALAYGGDLLLLDEPFAALDAPLRARLAPILLDRNREGLTVLVTHDPKDTDLFGARVLLCEGAPLSRLTEKP